MNIKFYKRRKFNRINFDGQVNLDFINGSYDHCQIKNINLTGMFVIGAFQQQLSENCLISLFQTAESKDINFRSSAKVVWKNDEGIAINFTSMTFDSYAFLVTTLIYEAEKPLAIQEDLPENCPFEITRQYLILPEVKVASTDLN